MDELDWKIRRFLVDEGYLFPQTDAEIERALKECEAMLEETIYEVYHNNEWKRFSKHEEACPHCGLQAQFHKNVTDCPPTTYF